MGPSFSPFVALHNLINAPLNAVLPDKGKATDSSFKTRDMAVDDAKPDDNSQVVKQAGNKKKPKRKKGKQKSA